MPDRYNRFRQKFLSGNNGNCLEYFEKNGYILEAAYCNLIDGNWDRAYELFSNISEIDRRAHWGQILVDVMTKDNLTAMPTFLEIKNFLEVDVNILLTYFKGNYVERIMRYADFFARLNIESYKYLGRVFYVNKIMPAAMFYLNKAKDRFYNDPELHCLLGEIFYSSGNIDECKKAVNACLNILPNYAPALMIKDKISKLEN